MKKVISVGVVLTIVLACGVLVGQRGAPAVPAATGPMLDVANKIADAINKQDSAALQKMVAPDAVYLDEDGHAPPVMAWVNRLTMGSKMIMISGTHGQTYNDTGWVSFNYTLTETFKEQPKMLKGTASLVMKKAASGDWMIQLVHGALEQHVADTK